MMGQLKTLNFSDLKFKNSSIVRKEQGAIIVVVALSMVGLLAMAGLALDLGKLYVTKTELQNSADACALSASRELTGANTNQLQLAVNAGIAAGISNSVMFQGESVAINASNISFSDTLYPWGNYDVSAGNPLEMRYVRCTVEKTGIANWLMQVAGFGAQQVTATAVATLAPGQTHAAIPVPVCSSEIAGISRGQWISPMVDDGTGNVMWANFSGQGANALTDVLAGDGVTNLPPTGTVIGDTGQKESVFQAWNTRFGIYEGKFKNWEDGIPDYSGVSYTKANWPACSNAFDDFVQQRGQYTPYLADDELNIPSASASSTDTHREHGGDRRLVVVPVVDCTDFCDDQDAEIVAWACVLMLNPSPPGNKPVDDAAVCDASKIKSYSCPAPGPVASINEKGSWFDFIAQLSPIKTAFAAAGGTPGGGGAGGGGGTGGGGTPPTNQFIYLEYLGLANEEGSPCTSGGLVGGSGSIGPRVPALVQ